MAVYEVDPLRDPRWPEFLQRRERASVFHTRGWLEALRRSYGYEAIAFTTSHPGKELENSVVFCRVNSWVTGRRLVSLPFSDHCEPLLNCEEDLPRIVSFLGNEANKSRLRYIEIRPLNSFAEPPPALCEAGNFAFHKLDLRPSVDEILKSCHKDGIRRKIRRAQQEGLTYEKGVSRIFLERFYRLFVMTRRRHGLPPSPFRWFCNLMDCMGERAHIRIASKDGNPVAATLALTFKNSVVYKYGCSDSRFHNLGGMPFLFWMMIVEAKSEGLKDLDLGRSDMDNEGLITFKDRWGSMRSTLTYWRLSARSSRALSSGRKLKIAKRFFEYAPDVLRIKIGNLLYRHLG